MDTELTGGETSEETTEVSPDTEIDLTTTEEEGTEETEEEGTEAPSTDEALWPRREPSEPDGEEETPAT